MKSTHLRLKENRGGMINDTSTPKNANDSLHVILHCLVGVHSFRRCF